MNKKLIISLIHPLWTNHKIGDTYVMDEKPDLWKIAYYPIFEDSKTGEVYNEPRALVEKPIKDGIDFREVPLRYLTKKVISEYYKSKIEIYIKFTERKLEEEELKTYPHAVNNILYIEEKTRNIT